MGGYLAGRLRVKWTNLHGDAAHADLLLLAHGDEVHAVPRSQVDVQNHASLDASRRLAQVSWQPAAATLVAQGERGRALWAQTLNRGALSVAGQLVGLAQLSSSWACCELLAAAKSLASSAKTANGSNIRQLRIRR